MWLFPLCDAVRFHGNHLRHRLKTFATRQLPFLLMLGVTGVTSSPLSAQFCTAQCLIQGGGVYDLVCAGGYENVFYCNPGDCEYLAGFDCPTNCDDTSCEAICDIMNYCESYETIDYHICWCSI
jgi:hypothetical protein